MDSERIPLPPFPLDEAAQRFRDGINRRWSRLEEQKAELLQSEQELDSVEPAKMNAAHIERLSGVKKKQAEILRQQLPILQEVAEQWPAMHETGRAAHCLATQQAYDQFVADRESSLKAQGWVDRIENANGRVNGIVPVNHYARMHPDAYKLLCERNDANNVPHFSADGIRYEIQEIEDLVRGAVKAAAA